MRQTEQGCYVFEEGDDYSSFFAKPRHHSLNPKPPSKRKVVVGFDVETRPLNPKAKAPNQATDILVGIGVSIYHDEPDDLHGTSHLLTVYGLVTDEYIAALSWFLVNKGWYAHNAMFDATVAQRYGLRLGPHRGDPRIIAYILGKPEAAAKPLFREYLGIETTDFNDLLEEHEAANISEVPLDVQADYCGIQDAEKIVLLERVMRKQMMETNPGAAGVYEKVELPMVNILIDMSHHGIKFDREAGQKRYSLVHKQRENLDDFIAVEVKAAGFIEYEKRGGKVWYPTCKGCRNGKLKRVDCQECWGAGKVQPVAKRFNPGSWQQRGAFLYDHLSIPKRRYAGGVQPWMIEKGMVDVEDLEGSTDALAMLQVKDKHKTIPLMLVRNKLSKEEGFLSKWIELSEKDGRLHTTFTNTTVATGRLSSREPNLTQVTFNSRNLMVADEEEELVAGDESQLELTIMAYMSKDPTMCEAIRNNWNLHALTAEAIYGIPWRDVDKKSPEYATSKVANFLTAFGGGPDKLIEGIEKKALEAPELGMVVPDQAEATRIIKAHKKKYKVYWNYTRWVVIFARDHGYSQTAFKRPRFDPNINSPNEMERRSSERALINLTIQGTASDLMKMIMVNIQNDPLMRKWGRMVLQVHDEIVSLVKKEHVAEYKKRLATHMELGQVFEPVVPLRVDVVSGPNWKETHK